MKNSGKYKEAINRQLIVMAIGVVCTLFAMPALISGNYEELFMLHRGRLRNMPLIVFLIVGAILLIVSVINIIKIISNRRKQSKGKR